MKKQFSAEDYKVFVTLGTTVFSSLVNEIINISSEVKLNVIIQTPDADNFSSSDDVKFVKFVEDVERFYVDCDLVVTHAGAGSIYSLLDMNIPFIAVPNLERADHHQKDIASFLSENNYAKVCNLPTELGGIIENII
ncbi:PssE/Cps14G family polysaccharide biosynthesis glycosyltransferase, partial [Photobacterium sanguinicancri]